MTRILAAALAAATLAFPALAQDGALVPFEGPRVEGLIGYDKLSSPFPGDAASSSGIAYGVAAGYDIRRDRLSFGPEVELTGASTDTRGDGLVASGDRLTIDAGRDLYVGGRIGFAVTPRALVYGKGGYTNFRTDEEYSGSATVGGYSRGVTSDGFRLGAGVEVQASGNTYVKAEYRYSDYADRNVDHRNQVVAGFGFRF